MHRLCIVVALTKYTGCCRALLYCLEPVSALLSRSELTPAVFPRPVERSDTARGLKRPHIWDAVDTASLGWVSIASR